MDERERGKVQICFAELDDLHACVKINARGDLTRVLLWWILVARCQGAHLGPEHQTQSQTQRIVCIEMWCPYPEPIPRPRRMGGLTVQGAHGRFNAGSITESPCVWVTGSGGFFVIFGRLAGCGGGLRRDRARRSRIGRWEGAGVGWWGSRPRTR